MNPRRIEAIPNGMRRALLTLGLTLGILLGLSACSANVGPDGLLIGGPCNDEFDCVTGAYCLRRATFPDGMCTTVCDGDDDCRGASACVEVESGACALTCDEDGDCGREGYTCQPLTRRGTAGDVRVCTGS